MSRCIICESSVPLSCNHCPCCDWPHEPTHEDGFADGIIEAPDDGMILV